MNMNTRSAGLLMHISSLPSAYGIGDLGQEAYSFADFLHESCQTYWQILPLTPVQQAQGFSPYSSISSLAGNTLLISPDLLVEDGLIKREEILPWRMAVTDKVDFEATSVVKSKIFDMAFRNAKAKTSKALKTFCTQESYWLEDFALFVALKDHFDQAPWYEWPEPFRSGADVVAIREFIDLHEDELLKTKWLQYIFDTQWKSLREYCKSKNLSIIGDMPFYISYDSVDVWKNKDIFDLSHDGQMNGVAGVPPDYFNEDGQWWGMPLYKWPVLKSQRYHWWLQRIRKNLELVDIIRLDHFRAFESYWHVPGESNTAAKGKWMRGPADDFFKLLKKKFPDMPFIAEDLGDITQQVFDLRDRFRLPGMKVLQFAFGDTLASSPHAPHNFENNFFVYTGTHDNNTSRGWFENEVDGKVKDQISQYAGLPVDERNVHKVLSRLAYSSVARTAIVPVQDVLGLDAEARMNKPASPSGNWQWRLVEDELDDRSVEWLIDCMKIYGRVNPACSDSA